MAERVWLEAPNRVALALLKAIVGTKHVQAIDLRIPAELPGGL